jgi:hypothetical protein
MVLRRLALLILACALLSGCARYEYYLIHPSELRRHVGAKTDQVIRLDPIEYKLRTVDNRLVMRAYNRSDAPIQLLGDQSVVVAPDGESHPIRGRTIAPGSHVKLIFPPLRPRVYRGGPTFGVGVGVRASRNRYRGVGGYDTIDPYDHEPAYLTMYEPAEPLYWEWEGQTEARIMLVYQRRGPAAATAPAAHLIRHEFTFLRRKM